MLKLVKLEKFAKRKPHQLSGGQRQRVALARSLAKRPKVLLLDEPLGALDKKLREETQFELMDLQQELGLTFVVVTHDQEEAMTMADRIAVMSHGKVVQVATPAEIYEAPNSRFVADFIGDVNIFDGKVTSAEDGYSPCRDDGRHPGADGVAGKAGERRKGGCRHPAREDQNRPTAAGACAGERRRRRDMGHRLPRRHDGFSHPARRTARSSRRHR